MKNAVVTENDIHQQLLDELIEARKRMDERGAGPVNSFWIERALALIAFIIVALAGWVWHTDRSVQHLEDVMYPASAASQIQNNQVRIMQQLTEIQRRLGSLENGR